MALLSGSTYLDDIAALVEQAELLHDREDALVELETRMGQIQQNKFVPGLSKPLFDRVLRLIHSYRGWSKVTPWTEIHDFFYDGLDNEPIRTTVMFDETQRKLHQRHIRKKKIASLDLKSHKEIDIRIALAVEEDLDPSIIPEIVEPNLVRIKQRRSYYYTPSGMTDPAWVFDLTLTWQGSTKEEAELNQKEIDPVMEVECECLSPMLYRQHKQEDHKYVAQSLLRKVLDFFPPPNEEMKYADISSIMEKLELVK
jgi:hypothetical protein